MLFFEEKYQEYEYICGIDEAGCGPLAGPVSAAAVVLPKGLVIEGLNDSKKLSAKRRNLLFDEIIDKALDYAIATIDHEEIDAINILEARLKAMAQAVAQIRADFALIDGNRAPKIAIPHVLIEGGDGRSMSIAAASVLAKVHRDRIMEEYDKTYPQYGFAKHKGYGTAAHIAAIRAHGASPIHRQTFLSRILNKGG